MPTGLVDVLTTDAELGDIDLVERSDETGGSGDGDAGLGTDDGGLTNQDTYSIGERDATITGTNTPDDLAADLEDAWNAATPDVPNWDDPLNWGPDWLDEATIVVLVLVALLILRPYMEGANTAADVVTR